jgi:hypothetical protein
VSESVEVSPARLLDTSAEKDVAAELWHGITNQQLLDWENLWKPAMQDLRQTLRARDIDPDEKLGTTFWNWDEKVEETAGFLESQAFSIMCEGKTQGLMIVNLSKGCRIPEQDGKPLVYVNYLEVAPWNQRPIESIKPRFSGVGSLLLRVAIETSLQNEFRGRIGLHALPNSESWYRNKCGMTDLGRRPGGLRYFEMTPAQAKAFGVVPEPRI